VTLTIGGTIDLDSLRPDWGHERAPRDNPQDLEFTLTDRSLTRIDQANLAVVPPGHAGSRKECGRLQAYGSELAKSEIRPGIWFCVITDQHRYALGFIMSTEHDLSGQLVSVFLKLIVWQPRDAG